MKQVAGEIPFVPFLSVHSHIRLASFPYSRLSRRTHHSVEHEKGLRRGFTPAPLATSAGGKGIPGTGHLLLPCVKRGPLQAHDLPVLDYKQMQTATGNPQRRAAGVLIGKYDVRIQAVHALLRPLITGIRRP